MGRAMLSKYLIQFSVDGRACVPSWLFDLRPNYGGGNEDNGDLPQKVPGMHCCMHSVPLMLGKIEGRRRRGGRRMRWLDGITNSMNISLSNSGS